ncbi:hypothetical protein OB13_15625 [Pontibacter sp. HJ8]
MLAHLHYNIHKIWYFRSVFYLLFMKKFYFLLVAALLLAGFLNQANAQSPDEIVVKRKSIGDAYFISGRKLSKEELMYVLDSHPEAKQELRLGARNKMPAAILSNAGGFLVGYQIGSLIGGGEVNGTMVVIGGGLAALSLPFSVAIKKRELRAISLYNAGLVQTAKPSYELRLGYASNGMSLKVTF